MCFRRCGGLLTVLGHAVSRDKGLIRQNNSGRSERIRTSGPLVPNEVRYQAALHSAAPPDHFSGRILLGGSYNGA